MNLSLTNLSALILCIAGACAAVGYLNERAARAEELASFTPLATTANDNLQAAQSEGSAALTPEVSQ